MLKGVAKIDSPDRQQAVKSQRPKRKNQGTVPRHPPMHHHKKQSPPEHCPGGQSERADINGNTTLRHWRPSCPGGPGVHHAHCIDLESHSFEQVRHRLVHSPSPSFYWHDPRLPSQSESSLHGLPRSAAFEHLRSSASRWSSWCCTHMPGPPQ